MIITTKYPDRVRAVADAIEANPEHFDMRSYYNINNLSTGHWADYFNANAGFNLTDCGTTACVAGWAVHIYRDLVSKDNIDYIDIATLAQDILGLSNTVLFYGQRDAIQMVKYLREIANDSRVI